MDLIYGMIDFIAEHLAAVVGVLVILLSVNSSRKKKKKAEQAADAAGGNENREKSLKKSFQDIMAEIEAELDEKPWDDDDEDEFDTPRRKRANPEIKGKLREIKEAKRDHPYAAPVPSAVPSVTVPVPVALGETLAKAEAVLDEVSSDQRLEVVKKKKAQPFSGSDLVTAVVMAEVLGEPKGLRGEDRARG